jgi:Icc-related predicted phosphoesterase
VDRVADRLGCPVLFVPGNHDLRDAVEETRGTNIDGRVVRVAGLAVAGFGGAGTTPLHFPYEWTESEADAALAAIFGGDASRPDLFLSHTPPARCMLDRTWHGEHVGSRAVRAWLRRARPRLFVCGHIHEAWGLERIEGVRCLNAGALGEPYGETIVWVVELDPSGPAGIESRRREPGKEAELRVW